MRIAFAVLLIGLGACAAAPTVTKESALLSKREIADMGLVCRNIKPIDSNIPRTICASDRAWDAYERITVEATEDLFSRAREVR